jgi:mitochondrial chaperone BCS1
MEILKLSCIGRSTQPIKDLLEEVYREHKDKEKSLTIIRRPFGVHYGRNGWSRISQKPRYV